MCGLVVDDLLVFNIYISHVKKIQNEERGTSPRFFFLNFFCYNVFAKPKKKLSDIRYYLLFVTYKRWLSTRSTLHVTYT